MHRLRSSYLITAMCLTALGIGAASGYAAPDAPKVLSAKDRQHLLTDHFQTFSGSSAIPEPVKAFYLTPTDSAAPDASSKDRPKFPMANPGKPWNAGDVVQDSSLPFRRLIFVAVAKGYCLITYEYGGIAYNRCAALYYFSDKKADLAWAGNVSGTWENLSEFRKSIRTKQYRDGGRL
ncbi:hypothetical protein CCAX7_37140 [Capsulimonas corticalis]|uniref:Uncharacterized protein n=1 Tax=Capsulimonas corticalis TaxID=2219043 RepID=A0A402D1B5_9BACT|nr:hypothetical protein [Capsulimonas corticalis]BDI31663.1 hypothetical protein CCAX7_37140 [Capsulimonas corticalis]